MLDKLLSSGLRIAVSLGSLLLFFPGCLVASVLGTCVLVDGRFLSWSRAGCSVDTDDTPFENFTTYCPVLNSVGPVSTDVFDQDTSSLVISYQHHGLMEIGPGICDRTTYLGIGNMARIRWTASGVNGNEVMALTRPILSTERCYLLLDLPSNPLASLHVSGWRFDIWSRMITQRVSLAFDEERRLRAWRGACLMGGIMQLVDEQGKMESSEVN